jgi:iron complex outermembrane receptor protein
MLRPIPVLIASAIAALAQQTTSPTPADTAPRKDTVIVTGTADPIAIEESDRVVRRQEVRSTVDNPATGLLANTLIDFLNRDSSVDLRQRGGSNIQTDVSIRGASFGQTLILLNGLRLNDVQSGHHSMDVPVPVETLDRVEILKGAGSTLYGSDAVGGVINFITAPPETSEARIRVAGGSFGTNQQRVGLTLVNGPRFSQQVSAYRDFSTGFIPNRDYRNLALTSSTLLRTRLGATSVLLSHNDKPFGAEQFYGNFNSWERTRTWWASIQQSLGERTQASFAYRRHTDLFVLYRDRPQVFTNRHAVESYQASFRRSEPVRSNTTVNWGVEGWHDGIASNNLGNHSRNRGSGYVALDMRALRRFSLSIGAREEVFKQAQQFVPSIAGGAWIRSTLKWRASVSRAFRLPTFTDLYYQDPGNRGSPDLRPESAWNYESGFTWSTPSQSMQADITVFHRHERDGIDYVRTSPTDIWRATNFQSLRFTGVEASAVVKLRPRHQRLDFSYTGLRGAQDALAGSFSKYTFNYPNHQGVAGWQAAIAESWFVRVRAGALKRYARDPYGLVDVYAARGKGLIRPFAQLTNLSGTRYQEILGVVMPGRAVLAGIEFVVTRR